MTGTRFTPLPKIIATKKQLIVDIKQLRTGSLDPERWETNKWGPWSSQFHAVTEFPACSASFHFLFHHTQARARTSLCITIPIPSPIVQLLKRFICSCLHFYQSAGYSPWGYAFKVIGQLPLWMDLSLMGHSARLMCFILISILSDDFLRFNFVLSLFGLIM